MKKIGVFDSGIGGLSVWREIVKLVPEAVTVYLADQAYVPYGNRDAHQLRVRSCAISRFLLGLGCEVIVVACNSASAAALDYLREQFPGVPFVGLEPAIKPAIALSKSKKICVLATPATFSGRLFRQTLARCSEGSDSDIQIIEKTCPELVQSVESGVCSGFELHNILKCLIDPCIAQEVDVFVLGCTHYPFLRNSIEELAVGCCIVDSGQAVARQVSRVIAGRGDGAVAKLLAGCVDEIELESLVSLEIGENLPVAHRILSTGRDVNSLTAILNHILVSDFPVWARVLSSGDWKRSV